MAVAAETMDEILDGIDASLKTYDTSLKATQDEFKAQINTGIEKFQDFWSKVQTDYAAFATTDEDRMSAVEMFAAPLPLYEQREAVFRALDEEKAMVDSVLADLDSMVKSAADFLSGLRVTLPGNGATFDASSYSEIKIGGMEGVLLSDVLSKCAQGNLGLKVGDPPGNEL